MAGLLFQPRSLIGFEAFKNWIREEGGQLGEAFIELIALINDALLMGLILFRANRSHDLLSENNHAITRAWQAV